MGKRNFALLLAACLVLCTLYLPSAQALPDNATLELRAEDQNGDVRDHIMDDEDLYYTVTVRQGTIPAQGYELLVEIVNNKNYELVYSEIMPTDDEFGEISDTVREWQHGQLDTLGTYIFYVNYSGTNLLTETFIVYSPVPFETSTIGTYGYDHNPISYFSETDTINYEIFVMDQWGEPYNPNNVDFNFYHDGTEILPSWGGWWYNDNSQEGSIIGYFRPADYPPWSGAAVFGDYQINLTFNGNPVKNFTFHITHIDVAIKPERAVYTQGETIAIEVTTDFSEAFTVNITDERGHQYLDATWSATPVSGNWSANYTLQEDMDDGWYHINIIRDGHLLRRESFEVKKYMLEIAPNKDGFLPGETMQVFYTITSNIDGSPTPAKLEWFFSYRNAASQRQTKTNSLETPTSSGILQIEVPTDISTHPNHDPEFILWANDTTGHTARDQFDIDVAHIAAMVTIENGNDFLAGQFVEIRANAMVAAAPVIGAHVKITLEQGDRNISVKSGLVTDSAGVCMYILPLSDNLQVGTYIIRVNVTSSVNSKETTEPIEDIEIVDILPLTIHINFDKSEYYPGEEATVTYSTLKDGVPISCNTVYTVRKDYVFGDVIATGHTDQGEFTFTVPSDFKGGIHVTVTAYTDAGEEYYGTKMTVVNYGHILVNANRDHYKPGETITFSYELMNIDSSLDLYYEIQGGGQVLARNVLDRNTFSLQVPPDNPPDEYTVTVFGYIDGNVVTGTETVFLKQYYLIISFDEKSYKPGDTITVHYKIVPVGNNPDIDSPIMLSYGIDQSEIITVWTDNRDGHITYLIPEYFPDGNYIFTCTGYFGGSLHNTDMVYEAVKVQEGISGQAVFNAVVFILLLLALLMGFAALQGKSLKDLLKRPTKKSYYTPPKEWDAPKTDMDTEEPLFPDDTSEPPFPEAGEEPEPSMPGEHSEKELHLPDTKDGDDLF